MTQADLVGEAFARGRAEGRALLMPYLIVGYPDPDGFLACATAAAEAGADMFELGIPFSDPVMDGPLIQDATFAVLERGQRVADALKLIERAAEATGKPLFAMTYYNIPFRMGLARFASGLADAGAHGAILPDLSVEDSGEWRAACQGAGISPVFIASQTSPPDRLRMIGEASRGFVYAASLLGVTGVRDALNERVRSLVGDIKAATDLPVAVGIGVSTREQAADVAGFADGVIVGSAIVQRAGSADEVGAFVRDLREAMRPART